MKVIVIGCTHAGTASILNLKKADPKTEITVYERNSTISFLSCGIALYVGGVVSDPKGLFYCSPEMLEDLGVVTKMRHDVKNVDFDKKSVTVYNMDAGEEFEDTYDKLIITTGSWPIVPDIQGINLENILLSKNYDHSNMIIEKAKTARNIVVVGAGYIGVELVEAFKALGKNVSLIDGMDRILSRYLDKEFTDIAEKALKEHGIDIILNEKIVGFEGQDGRVSKVLTERGAYDADLVILSIGFRPNTALFKGKLEMLPNGAIIVDEYMRTSREGVFAAGDSCSVMYNPTGKHEYIPLATNAVRMGTLIAKNINCPALKYMGTQGTSGIKIIDYNIASTGLTEESAKAAGIEVETSTIVDNYRPEFMPQYESLQLKVVFEKKSRVIIGAQILSKHDLTQSINTLSVCIQNKMTIDELAFVDFFFQPHFNKPWNYLNSVGLNALK
ncbi:FAD-dependent oxidoreductase [Pseudobacteroides cellulosolvens]|uniref:NADH peroxidase n=1 Tax=Pseudobacteroides cellulosolvens ATCC 35603 = DSM 2933 TaxID=398512 RepID=A0A0L6JV65_9FIRM|nr:FAD-dependent oxidoreductase [Pseudobacteroides cellulosolvens]KNY29550.1 NADH peroxidase [Pseudobacteroides cellulosolvens ATCC 35603 = DSM 2933]